MTTLPVLPDRNRRKASSIASGETRWVMIDAIRSRSRRRMSRALGSSSKRKYSLPRTARSCAIRSLLTSTFSLSPCPTQTSAPRGASDCRACSRAACRPEVSTARSGVTPSAARPSESATADTSSGRAPRVAASASRYGSTSLTTTATSGPTTCRATATTPRPSGPAPTTRRTRTSSTAARPRLSACVLVPMTSSRSVASAGSTTSGTGKSWRSATSTWPPYPPSRVKPMSPRLSRHWLVAPATQLRQVPQVSMR